MCCRFKKTPPRRDPVRIACSFVFPALCKILTRHPSVAVPLTTPAHQVTGRGPAPKPHYLHPVEETDETRSRYCQGPNDLYPRSQSCRRTKPRVKQQTKAWQFLGNGPFLLSDDRMLRLALMRATCSGVPRRHSGGHPGC